MSPEVVEARFEYARNHLRFATQLYKLQIQGGRYFPHEHPENASSWEEKCIHDVLGIKGIHRVVGDQCYYGLKAKGNSGMGPARKATAFMTNSPCIALQLRRRCPNRGGYPVHRHVQLNGGKAKAAQIYPPGLCKAVCRALAKQLEVEKTGQYLLMNVEYNDEQSSKDLIEVAKQLEKKYKTVEAEDEWQDEVAWDDVSGAALSPEEVRRARAEEIKYVHDMELYEKVPTAQCYAQTGKAPISTRWIDINKGDQAHQKYRSRRVAREINTHRRDDLFAATPPLEAFKIIVSLTDSSNQGEIVMIKDISRAFFHARAKREVFVQLPKEDVKAGEEAMCGRLNYSIHGTRDAAQN